MSLVKDAYPELRKEWHPSRNGGVNFDELDTHASRQVWWVCARNPKHEWPARVRNRAIEKNGCPYCSGRKVLREDSFAALHPELAAQWHPTKNGKLDPWKIRPQSNKHVWWQCQTPFKHEWRVTVSTRVRNNSGCRKCNQIGPSLAKAFPEIAKQWHPTKNGQLTPEGVSAGSRQLVWWRCSKDPTHAWQASVYGRVRAKADCRLCAKRAKPERLPTLDISFPELASQWHPSRNDPLRPSDVYPSSGKKVWWICPDDPTHVWDASVRNRAKLGHGCRFCAYRSRFVSPGRSLADRFPEIAAGWHPTKNAPLKPSEVTPGSAKRVWWQCKANPAHEWQATVTVRTQKPSGGVCPQCRGFTVNAANSLAAKYPDIAKEWHPTKNTPLTPDAIKKASGKRVWWQCLVNPSHEWSTTVKHRTILRTGCPFCALFHSAESNANYTETFSRDMRSLRTLLKLQPDGPARLRQAFFRMVYSSAITALETYLSDAFYQTVIQNSVLIERLMLTTPEFNERKYSLSDVVEWRKQTKAKVSDYLFNIVWHNLARVRCMYRDVLGVKFPDDLNAVHVAVVIRHDIVHRGGKTKGGKLHNFRESDLAKLFVAIEAFVNEIEKQLKSGVGGAQSASS